LGGGSGSKLGTTLGAIALVIAIVALAVSFVVPGPTGSTGAIGSRGPSGGNFTVNTTLLPGQNESGEYSAWGGGIGSYLASTVNYRVPLGADLPAGNVTFIAEGGSYTTGCPGPGYAHTGQLCVYEAQDGGRSGSRIFNPTTGLNGASQWGFSIWFTATAASSWSYGSWTVGAP
jgi:hypothetical protein